MATFDYAALVPIFSQIVSDFEMGTISIESRTPTKDPANPLKYTVAVVAQNIEAIVTGVSSRRVEGTSILEGDLYVIITSDKLNVAPQDSDVVIIDGKDYEIVRINAVPPAGTPVLYRIRVRSF